MPKFNYSAVSSKGQKVVGERESDSRDEVANFLHQQGLIIMTIEEQIGVDLKKLGSVQVGGVPLKEKVIFVKQLSTMMGAGLPILQALDILVQQTTNNNLKEKLTRVYKSVEAGSSLSEAFRKDKSIFNDLQISLIVAGETSGTLNEVLMQIGKDLEKSKQLRAKIVGALIYPVILIVVMLAVLVMMLIFMIPTVKKLYADFGVTEIPAFTSILIAMSDAISNPVGLVIILLVGVFIFLGFRYYYTTPIGRKVIDRIMLKIPVFGTLIEKAQVTQFCQLLAMLLHNGVSIVESLEVIGNSMSNSIYKEEIEIARSEVVKGNSLSVPLARGGVFPLVLVKMLATGEETGKLDKISGDMAVFYETELNDLSANLTKLIEPFILLSVGGLVGFMAVAVYLPLYQLGEYIR